MKADKPDPFANLGPPGIARRFSLPEAVAETLKAADRKLRAERLAEAAIKADDIVNQWQEAISEAIVQTPGADAAEAPKRKPGRPKSDKPKPWEGICSKTEWYRRRKAGKLDAR